MDGDVPQKLNYVEALRMKSVAGPRTKLPGKKQVPTEFSRGVALTSELAWWWTRTDGGRDRAVAASRYA